MSSLDDRVTKISSICVSKKGNVEYTIYFEKQEDGNYKVVFSDRDEHGGKALCDGVIADSMALMAFEHSIAEHIKGW